MNSAKATVSQLAILINGIRLELDGVKWQPKMDKDEIQTATIDGKKFMLVPLARVLEFGAQILTEQQVLGKKGKTQ